MQYLRSIKLIQFIVLNSIKVSFIGLVLLIIYTNIPRRNCFWKNKGILCGIYFIFYLVIHESHSENALHPRRFFLAWPSRILYGKERNCLHPWWYVRWQRNRDDECAMESVFLARSDLWGRTSKYSVVSRLLCRINFPTTLHLKHSLRLVAGGKKLNEQIIILTSCRTMEETQGLQVVHHKLFTQNCKMKIMH